MQTTQRLFDIARDRRKTLNIISNKYKTRNTLLLLLSYTERFFCQKTCLKKHSLSRSLTMTS